MVLESWQEQPGDGVTQPNLNSPQKRTTRFTVCVHNTGTGCLVTVELHPLPGLRTAGGRIQAESVVPQCGPDRALGRPCLCPHQSHRLGSCGCIAEVPQPWSMTLCHPHGVVFHGAPVGLEVHGNKLVSGRLVTFCAPSRRPVRPRRWPEPDRKSVV